MDVWSRTGTAVEVDGTEDARLVRRITEGEFELFEVVMRRHNQQLYRAARAVLGSDGDVEDVLQQAYLNAYAHLAQFEARAQLSTWLTRIVVNEACARRRRARRGQAFAADDHGGEAEAPMKETVPCPAPTPEQAAYSGELRRALEAAVDDLPETYRVVYVLRDVEGLSTNATATALSLGDEAVKTRLHRARAMLRRSIASRIGGTAAGLFQFHAPRCDRVVAGVMRVLRPSGGGTANTARSGS